MTESDELPLCRDIDKYCLERLRHLETKMEELEEQVERELHEFERQLQTHWQEDRQIMNSMTHNVQRILDRQQSNQPAMESLNTIIHAGLLLRWAMIAVVGTLAAIGTAATAWDAIKDWLK